MTGGTIGGEAPPRRTPLYEIHRELGAKMVPFAGYEMPVSYPGGIIAEHTHTRTRAGLFDVSHMGQIRLQGDRAAERLEALVPADIVGLGLARQRYALLTNEAGGILDDVMVSRWDGHLVLVVNAARKEADLDHLERHLGDGVAVEMRPDLALVALQGPAAASVMARLAPASSDLPFMGAMPAVLGGAPCTLSRSGYTGEDGFEISVPADAAPALFRSLLAHPEVEPVGLGARDSLRLEAGLCLYGHDIDERTTPVEAGLVWAIGKARRRGGARAGGFPGRDRIFRQLDGDLGRRRVGISPAGRVVVREGATLLDGGGASVGRVTSGGFGPTVERGVAMAYVDLPRAAPDTTLEALVRDRPRPVAVTSLPFVPHRYHRG